MTNGYFLHLYTLSSTTSRLFRATISVPQKEMLSTGVNYSQTTLRELSDAEGTLQSHRMTLRLFVQMRKYRF